MNGSEFQAYHVREAARLRRLIANATTPAVKTRLIEQAEEHERLAEGFDEDAEEMCRRLSFPLSRSHLIDTTAFPRASHSRQRSRVRDRAPSFARHLFGPPAIYLMI